MSSVSYTLLTHQSELSYSGDKIRADAYYGNTDGVHTVSVTYANFTGRFVVEGTLSTDPQEDDWFAIEIEPGSYYKEYTGESGTDGFTFEMNLLFVRAKVDREYLAAGSYNQNTHGTINKSLVNV